ncbi:MAG: PilZ domain-containing protein [Deltaproteobacteria bacterium]|nr:PilZ domain-containing protein [Deltaproteobacteria bacterium]
MADSVPPQSERRAGVRYLACFPGYVVLPDGAQRIAVIRDLSTSGVRLLTDTIKLHVDDVVKLELHIGKDPDTCSVVRGRVVRVEPVTDIDLWKRCFAVSFDEPLAMSDEDIARFQGLPPVFEFELEPLG